MRSAFLAPSAPIVAARAPCRALSTRRPRVVRATADTPRPATAPDAADPPARPAMEDCDACARTGFVPCKDCVGEGVTRNTMSGNVFFCPVCVGHKKLRCPVCGGKCYMCE